MKNNLVGILFFAFILGACAHHRDVRPGADGIHRVVVQTDDTAQASRNAIKQADHFCKQSGQKSAFVNEEQKYTGDMDEKTYKKAKRATKAAKTAGGAAYVFGNKRASDVGGIVGLGGQVADSAIGHGYTVEMSFKCM